jgi:transposase
VDRGARAGVTSEMAEPLKALEREICELKQANEILREGEPVSAIGPRTMASACFAQAELDRRSRT